jgi:hypothetical protein
MNDGSDWRALCLCGEKEGRGGLERHIRWGWGGVGSQRSVRCVAGEGGGESGS